MRNFSKSVKGFIVVAIVAVMLVPMVAGIILLGMDNTQSNLTRLRAASIENEAFNGRSSNRTAGTGFDESKIVPAVADTDPEYALYQGYNTVGANISEPDTDWWDTTVGETWADIYNGKTFNELLRNVDTKSGSYGYLHALGDYRVSTANAEKHGDGRGIESRGKTADYPWIISDAQEFAFWAKFISLSMNGSTNLSTTTTSTSYVGNFKNTFHAASSDLDANNQPSGVIPYVTGSVVNAIHAYASAPYFQLGADIDLKGKQWVPAYFYNTYTTNTTYDILSNRANRVYFDGANYTIKNAYVKQSFTTTAAGVAYPSVLGNLPYKSQVKNLVIEDSYVSQGATANPAAIVSLSNSVAYNSATNSNSIFSNITVRNSIAVGSLYHASGITGNAGIIRDSKVHNVTLSLGAIAPTATFVTRGIGSASQIIGCEVKNTSSEINNPNYSTFALGVGSLTTTTTYLLRDSLTLSGTGDFMTGTLPSLATLNGSVLVTSGPLMYPVTYPDASYALGGITEYEEEGLVGDAVKGGFYNNIVKDSKIGITAKGGTTSNYGHAAGIGISYVNMAQSYVGNTLENSLVSVKTEENSSTTTVYSTGIIMMNFTGASTPAKRTVTVSDNRVLNSTVSAVTQAATTVVSGISSVLSESIGTEISACYTENTDIESISREHIAAVTTYANGINFGFATSIKDCIVGSGNIIATNVKSSIFAYGIGSTLGGSTTAGTTGALSTYGRKYFQTSDGANFQNKQAAIDHAVSLGETAADIEYIGDKPQTVIENCINFSNITTSSVGTIYAAGIGMAEGFKNCINYGNVMGNWVGGIAVGFSMTTNNNPSVPNENSVDGKTSSNLYGALRPLIIENCANYGNLIKAENDIATSYMGGMFAIYTNTLNYQRFINGIGTTTVEFTTEDLNGKHVLVKDCISAGKFFYYVRQPDNKYMLTDNLTEAGPGMNVGMIFGRLNLAPYTFIDDRYTTTFAAEYADFIKDRFVIENNFYNANGYDFTKLSTSVNTVAQATKARLMEVGGSYDTGSTSGVINNLTPFEYSSQTPAANVFSNVLGTASASLVPYNHYAGTLASYVYEMVYNDVAKNWEGNEKFYNKTALLVDEDNEPIFAEDGITQLVGYSLVDTLLASGETLWDVTSGIAQMSIADDGAYKYPFQILAFDKNGAAQGYAPNVQILPLSADDDNDGEFEFFISEFQNPETGKSVLFWANASGLIAPYAVGTEQSIAKIGNLPMVMLNAMVDDTEFVIKFSDDTANHDYMNDGTTSTEITGVVKEVETALSVKYTPTSDVLVSAIIWYVESNTVPGLWEEFSSQYFTTPLEFSTDPGEINGDTVLGFKVFTTNLTVDNAFIIKYAKGTLGAYSFSIKAVISNDTVHKIDIDLSDLVDGSSLGVNWDTYTSTSTTSVLNGSTLMLTANYESDLYDFGGFVFKKSGGIIIAAGEEYETIQITDDEGELIDIVVPYFEIVSNDGALMQIVVTGPIDSISFKLTPREYDISIQTYALASSGTLRIPLEDESLLNGLLKTRSDIKAVVNEGTVLSDEGVYTQANLEVAEFYEDEVNQCYYRFVQWEFITKSGEEVSTSNVLTILDSQMLGTFLRNSLRDVDGERKFTVVAVFKRQVELNVNMYRPGFEGENYDNSFKIFNNSNELPLSEFNQPFGSIIVDENTQLRIEFMLDTRLKVEKIDGVLAAKNNFFANNMLYLTVNNYRYVDVSLTSRPATVNVFAKIQHKDSNEVDAMGFLKIGLTDEDAKTFELDLEDSNKDQIDLRFLSSALKKDYRKDGVGLKIYNVVQDRYDDLSLTGDVYYRDVDSTFFIQYVNKDGICDIVLFLIATYEVDLSIASSTGIKKDTGTGYVYSDDIGNGFDLTFNKAPVSEEMVGTDGTKFKFVLDYGTKIEYSTATNAYTTFGGSGASDSEKAISTISIYSTRELPFVFTQKTYTLNVTKEGGKNAKLNSYTETFELNSTITIAFDVDSLYSLNDIKIKKADGTILPLSQFAVRKGNSITIKATPEFIDAVGAVEGIGVDLTTDVSTGVSTIALGGFGGGGVLLILLILLAIYLVIRSKNINEKRKKAEALAREYEQRFNIGGVIAKLKEDAATGNLKDTKTIEAEKAAKEAAENAEKGETGKGKKK